MDLLTTIIGAAVIAGGIWAYDRWLAEQRDAAWTQVGAALGLQFQKIPGSAYSGQLNGELDGVKVQAHTLTEGSGKNKREYTLVTARINGRVPLDMKISREGFLQKAGKLFGKDDIQVGDEELDRQFLITGSNASTIRSLLTAPAVKGALLTTQKHSNSLSIELGEVRLKEPDVGKNHEKLTRYIRMSVTLAAALSAASPQPAQVATATTTTGAALPPAPNMAPAPLPGASDDPNSWW